MRINSLKATIKSAVRGAAVLLLAAGAAVAQQQINLTAAPTSLTLPDASTVPMWGYSCGAVVGGSTATCAALNPNAGTGWSPVVITVPYTGAGSTGLTINLTNNLTFTPTGSTTPNNIPTSLMIVGQVGGGLGGGGKYMASPDHSMAQGNTTWPIANTGAQGTPPVQGPRVQSFGTEVAAGTGTPVALTWSALRPGTYLLESGTHPSIQVPMGLIGVLVVTQAPSGTVAGTAYPAGGTGNPVAYNAEVPLEFSEIDPAQNRAVDTAVRTAGFSGTATYGPYAATSVSHVNVTSGGSGYTSPPTVTIAGGGGSHAVAVATIDTSSPSSPTYQQVTSITLYSGGSGYTGPLSVLISGGGGSGATATAQLATGTNTLAHCGEGMAAAAAACYPPAVNYTPLYYLINGAGFNKNLVVNSTFPVSPATVAPGTGTILVRFVNAGVRMHVPSIVQSQTTGFDGVGNAATVNGFTLIAEDGNPVPGNPRVQTDVFMAAGKTYDVMINTPGGTAPAIPVYDRELSLSGNSSERDAGMIAYISVNGSGVPASPAFAGAQANPDGYNSLLAGKAFAISDPSKGVIANDVNVYGVTLVTQAAHGIVALNTDGTFSYTPSAGSTATTDSFGYCANGATAGNTTLCTTVALGAAALGGPPSANNVTFTANTATYLKIPSPGVLSVDSDPSGYPLKVVVSSVTPPTGVTITMDSNGGFTASVPGQGVYQFTYQAQNAQGTTSNTATVTLNFPAPSNLAVSVYDAKQYQANCGSFSSAPCSNLPSKITDYRWIIEEDKTFYIDPNCTANTGTGPPTPGCPGVVSGGTVPTFGVNFHTSHMDFVAQGCTGPLSCEAGQTVQGVPSVCDLGNGACRPGLELTPVDPGKVVLDPTKRYYISVLPGDSANTFNTGNQGNGCTPTATTSCPSVGHTMSGAEIAQACNPLATACTGTATPAPVTVLVQPGPLPPGKLSVMVFEDDFPLNGEQDPGGGIDVLSPNEPGLGGFNIVIWDAMGNTNDFTGQANYDMFNQPFTNSLDGTIDPATGLNACPITKAANGITGMIVTCPKYEGDNVTLSPLAGQAVVANMYPGRYVVQAYPGADRIARGEEWLQTNTLDGQHPHDAFIRIGEPSYFQEYGPAGYHDTIGFANPAIINARHDAVCAGAYGAVGACNNTIQGQVTGERISRTPDQRLYPSGSHDAWSWTQCWVSLGDPDAEDFMFAKCDANGNFKFTNVPGGEWRITIGDQWNDAIIDGLSTPANVSGGQTLNMGQIGTQQWQSNIYTRTFIDDNIDGVSQSTELGIPFLNTTVRYRDGSLANNLVTDFNGVASFNETFPLFNWYAVEADTTRYKTTGIHTVYDAGGPADGSTYCGTSNGAPACGGSTIGNLLANTHDPLPLPADLSVPGAVYCPGADCTGLSIQNALTSGNALAFPSGPTASTGRIDPPWVESEGWMGYIGQFNFIEFGKAPYASCPPACVTVPSNTVGNTATNQAGENGGIHGHVVYASTRPFDDPQLLVQAQWEPLVPNVTINLYQEGFAADGVTPTLKLVDSTQTSSWDNWAQGFYPNSTAGSGSGAGQKPYMNCPGQLAAPTANSPGDFFFFSLNNQPDYLDVYNAQHNGGTAHTLPYNSQYKCYDGMHNWNQIQPAPYDGMYSFPSVTGIDPTTGKPLGTNCAICVTNPDTTDKYRYGTPMLPPGKYVVEVVMPPGYEVVKEEDKNILIGDNFIAPVTVEFPGLAGSVFIMPDQASVASTFDASGSGYNATNAQNATQSLGAAPRTNFVPGFLEPVWPCVGELRQVPDFISLYPQSLEVAPFAGSMRNLCDRKEVTLDDQAGAIAKFYIYTSTHIASKYTGVITDDFTSEFDPFAPTFGEKFAPANLPISTKDYTGNEISRVYSDHFGIYDGLNYSTWEVNPPNPTGYAPTMMVQCMNDPGPIKDTNPSSPTFGQMITDPLFNPAYSDFCYELPYMPGVTDYLDTPVVPTQAFVGAGYNNPDCAYPDATPAVSSVTSADIAGPWVSATGHTITITALGDITVPDYGYAGPSANVAPFNAKTVKRHFGFGSTTGTVTVGGVPLTVSAWSDTSITGTVNLTGTVNGKPASVPLCAVQQQAQYGGSTAHCGELVITSTNGKQSIDAVTVTIGGKKPTLVTGTIQSAIDAALPGDMLLVPPGRYQEMLIMWKPVRLQGVGAGTSIIDANAMPAGKLLDPWRRHVNCLFGLTMQGVPIDASHPYDPSGTYSCPDTGWNPKTWSASANNPQVDRLPLEAVVGWDATLNGNLAELLQEPSLMGAYEGAGVTVVSKGLDFHGALPWSDGTEAGAFPTVTTLLTGTGPNAAALPTGDSNKLCVDGTGKTNRFPSNFMCNPSSIDGLTITNSSQGGSGVFVHGWSHNLQIANDRIYNNAGTLSGGISVGQGEFALPYIVGSTTNSAPGSCSNGAGFVTNQHEPYCLDLNVNVHHNSITDNSSTGDELFSATLAGGGGVTFCTGADYYKFNYNWVCGNMSSGEGGALVQLGFAFNGDIEHNSMVFNQATNPTIPTNGGGIMIQGTPDTDPVCGTVPDQDCPPGLSDGTGPGLLINANLIQGNSAESGSGGGIRLQQVNGTDVFDLQYRPNQVVFGQHHQQHHHQQRGWLGRRGRFVARCPGRQHVQQHGCFQRLDRFFGRAGHQYRCSAIERARGQLRTKRSHWSNHGIVPAACRPGERAQQLVAHHHLHRNSHHMPRRSLCRLDCNRRFMQRDVLPGPVQRPVLAEPVVPDRNQRRRERKLESAKPGFALQRIVQRDRNGSTAR